jgi:signal transduction histidine kinase
MFTNLRTSTKLLILCATFSISIGVPVYALVTEKLIAIDFARRELVGSRYLLAVRSLYEEILAARSGTAVGRAHVTTKTAIEALVHAEGESGGAFQTAALAQAVAAALHELEAAAEEEGRLEALVLGALATTQALAARIGDDSNLALDPDLDTFYVQSIIVRKLPTFLRRLIELQGFFEASVKAGSSRPASETRLPILASLLRSTAAAVRDEVVAAYRGNSDGTLKNAVEADIAGLILSLESYLEAVGVSMLGVDARDGVAYQRMHESAVRQTIRTWAVAQAELDRLLQRRIDTLYGRMVLTLILIGVFAGLSIVIAVLTHRHIVRPLERLEAVASTVRRTRDYSLRAEYGGQDEIGRVTAAFNDMLAELAAARMREATERAEFARVARLTAVGEMAASIAHEVNQPLAAIVTSGNAGLRWLANSAPDLNKIQNTLQRIVRDGVRASEIVGGVRAMFKKDARERTPLQVGGLVEEVVALLHSELRSEQISVQLEREGEVPSVLANRVQLQQVLLNLIANAIDAMRPVGDRSRVLRLSVGARGQGEVVVRVADTGSGIDPAVRDRLFDPFFTTKSGGMGWGCRSAGRSSRRTEVSCRWRPARRTGASFNSRCRRGMAAACDVRQRRGAGGGLRR